MDKPLEKRLITWLKQQKSACGYYLKMTVALGILNGIALIIQAWLIATVLQGVIINQMDKSVFGWHFAILVGLIILRAALGYAKERVSFEAGCQLRQTIRQSVRDKLTQLGPAFINGKPAGSWASIVLEQVEDLHDYYGRYLPQVSLAAMIPLIILVVVFPINWAGALVLLLTAPLIPLFMILVGMGAADANRKNFSALARLSGHFMDRLKGLGQLQLFYRGEAELKAIERASDEFRERTMTVLRMAFLSSAVLEFFAAVSIAVLAVYFGFSYLGHLDFGHYGSSVSLYTGLFILILAPEFYQPLRDLGTHYHAKAQAVGAAEQLMDLLEYQPEDYAYPENTTHNEKLANEQGAQNSAKKVKLSIVAIEAKDLSIFSFDGQRLLGPVSFSISATQKIAIVGPSGAGKSSLLNGILGFLPYQGELYLLDDSGQRHALREIDIGQWRQQLAWLGQNPQLFHGSIRDNLNLSGADLSDQQLFQLLDRANIGDFVRSLPQGLEYLIKEQAAGLSVGQAQRIALARALSQQVSFFILDEPSASLDSKSEQLVMASLAAAMQDKACLMVTHRLEQLDSMDHILVLDQGQIVQQGRYQQLSQNAGVFQSMLQSTEGETVADLDMVPNLAIKTTQERQS